jgi:hypothetical protein
MEEKEPATVLLKLLQLMCQVSHHAESRSQHQNTRADYAAIAISDDTDVGSLRLVAAGSFDNIVLQNVPLQAPGTRTLCPVSYITQVYRTSRVSMPDGSCSAIH